MLDPGHGGIGPLSTGCAYGDLVEKDYALSFSQALAEALTKAGHFVGLTRQSDRNVSFTGRALAAHTFRADAAISIHVNANKSPKPYGLQVYVMPAAPEAKRLAEAIHKQTPAALASKWNNVIEASLDGVGDDAVLRRYAVPAVLLELGFASNPDDRAYLLSAAGKAELLAAIVEGVRTYVTPRLAQQNEPDPED